MWTALMTSGNYYCLNNKCSRATAIKGVLKREIKSKKGAHYEGWVFFLGGGNETRFRIM